MECPILLSRWHAGVPPLFPLDFFAPWAFLHLTKLIAGFVRSGQARPRYGPRLTRIVYCATAPSKARMEERAWPLKSKRVILSQASPAPGSQPTPGIQADSQ